MNTIAFSSNTNEWYTPGQYLEAARLVLGGIDLDPASDLRANNCVMATKIYTQADNGLLQTWHGRIWLNPPYGKTKNKSNQGLWTAKLIQEYNQGNVSAAITLVNLVPGYKWFNQLWQFPVCLVDHCISFTPGAGQTPGKAKVSSAFFYVGPHVPLFQQTFIKFGAVGQLATRPDTWC